MPWARFNSETCLFILLNICWNLHWYIYCVPILHKAFKLKTMLLCVSMLVKKPHGELRPLPAPAEAGMFLHGREGRTDIPEERGSRRCLLRPTVPTVLLLLEGGRKNQASCGSSSQKIGFASSHQLLRDNFMDKALPRNKFGERKSCFVLSPSNITVRGDVKPELPSFLTSPSPV